MANLENGGDPEVIEEEEPGGSVHSKETAILETDDGNDGGLVPTMASPENGGDPEAIEEVDKEEPGDSVLSKADSAVRFAGAMPSPGHGPGGSLSDFKGHGANDPGGSTGSLHASKSLKDFGSLFGRRRRGNREDDPEDEIRSFHTMKRLYVPVKDLGVTRDSKREELKAYAAHNLKGGHYGYHGPYTPHHRSHHTPHHRSHHDHDSQEGSHRGREPRASWASVASGGSGLGSVQNYGFHVLKYPPFVYGLLAKVFFGADGDLDRALEGGQQPGLERRRSITQAAAGGEVGKQKLKASQKAFQKAKEILKWINGTMAWTLKWNKIHPAIDFAMNCLRGVGQVFFMNSPLSGLLIVAAFFAHSSRVALHGVIGVMTSTLAAHLLGFNSNLIQAGLYGYNGVLCGLGLATFHSPKEHGGWDSSLFPGVVGTAALSSVLFTALGKLLIPYNVPPFTLPFNLSMLAYLVGTASFSRLDTGPVVTPAFPSFTPSHSAGDASGEPVMKGIVRGLGQVFLLEAVWSGILVFAAMMVCSRISAAAAVTGSATAYATAAWTGAGRGAMASGLYGYNAALTAAALFGMFYVPSYTGAVLAIFASVVVVIVQGTLAGLFLPAGLPVATLPFCLVTLAFVLCQGATEKIVAVPLASITVPEDHYRRIKVLRGVFKLFKTLLGTGSCGGADKMLNKFITSGRKTVSKQAVDDLFDAVDANGGGTIEFNEFTSLLLEMGVEGAWGKVAFLKDVFRLLDQDNSGALDREEFFEFAVTIRGLQELRGRLEQFFFFADADMSGGISVAEIASVQEYLGAEAMSPEETNALMVAAGSHHDEDEIYVEDLLSRVAIQLLERREMSGAVDPEAEGKGDKPVAVAAPDESGGGDLELEGFKWALNPTASAVAEAV